MKTGWLIVISGAVLLGLVYLGWVKTTNRGSGELKHADIRYRAAASVTFPTPLSSVTPTPRPVVMVFGGDVMWDRHVRQEAGANGGYGAVLAGVRPVLAGADIVVVNLEGPITSYRSVSVGSQVGSHDNYVFTFAPAVVETMAAANVRIANLGNNHIFNFGVEGYQQTVAYLDRGGVEYFGDVGRGVEIRSLVKQVRGYTIGLVNYNQFAAGGRERALGEVARLEPAVDMLVVYAHWGTEYVPVSGESIKELAHELAAAGADLIIGSHPHVVQDKEVYLGVPIYYSLGNMVFDQYFRPEVRRGRLVRVEIEPMSGEINLAEIPIAIKKGGKVELVPAKQGW